MLINCFSLVSLPFITGSQPRTHKVKGKIISPPLQGKAFQAEETKALTEIHHDYLRNSQKARVAKADVRQRKTGGEKV